MKVDLKKLKKADEVYYTTIKAVDQGEILDFNDVLLAVGLFDRWREKTFLCDERYKNFVIESNITIKGHPVKITTYTRNRYQRDETHKKDSKTF